ncbi:MAG: four-carbon acid sugar kinase family protein [Rubrobacteraceae bacterium]
MDLVQVAIIADDLTGAADSGVQLARAGYRAAVAFRGTSVEKDFDAVVADTDSRFLAPGLARERVLEAGRELKDARIAYKKIDSTLRGPIAAEIAAAMEVMRREKAIIAPAFPGAGRSTRGGAQLVDGVPVHEAGFADDPLTPVWGSHVPSLLADVGRVETLSVDDLRDAGSVREALGAADCVVVDAESEAHLEALVRAAPDPSSVLWAGSAGLAAAIGAVYPGPGVGGRTEPPSSASGVLVVVGSVHEVAREQLRRLVSGAEIEAVPLDASEVAEGRAAEAVERAFIAALASFEEGKSVALHSTIGEASDRASDDISVRVADALAEVAVEFSKTGSLEALVLTGGDTAVRVARKLGGRGILIEREIEPGVPAGALVGTRPYRVVTKAGGFGGPDTLKDAVRHLLGKEGA